MREIKSLFFFLVVLTSLVCAQEKTNNRIKFSGVVINRETTIPVQNANCWNGEQLTTTDVLGRFSMNIIPGDTVRVTHVGYKAYHLVVPDTLETGEYMMAIFVSSDTIRLPEVLIRRRFKQQSREYRMNARDNMAGVVRDAYKPQGSMSVEDNQKRILDDFSASTNKGHVNVGFGVGAESYRAYKRLKRSGKFDSEAEPLNREEIDLIKLLFSIEQKENK